MSYLDDAQGTRVTSQDAPMREDQIKNSAGGFAWAVGPKARLLRWLVLGSEGGSYYASQHQLTTENVGTLKECITEDGPGTVALIVEVSESGRAPKNDPAIFALAACSGFGDEETRRAAHAAIPRVCRIGTHLFTFTRYVEKWRGWGPSLAKGVGTWYTDKDADALAYQAVKYRQRDGVSHRDVLRLAHPAPPSAAHASVFGFMSGNVLHEQSTDDKGRIVRRAQPWASGDGTPAMIEGFLKAQEAETPEDTAKLILDYGLPREALKTEHLTAPVVWEAMLDKKMPMTAMIRNLANMTRAGVLAPGSNGTKVVLDALSNDEALRKARIHPISVLMALRTYEAGHGFRGGNTWNPVVQIVDALDGAFYKAFGNVESTGKRFMLALDVSGSMGTEDVAGVPNFTPRDASAAMALVTAATEQNYEIVGFHTGSASDSWNSPQEVQQSWWGDGDGLTPLTISPRQRLNDAINVVANLPFGGTDCALPMLYALDKEREVDAFVIYTDSETWAGGIHPAQALVKYREQSGIDARLIVVGMVSNEFTIADPNDPGMLDVVGFDTATPNLIADFAAGRV